LNKAYSHGLSQPSSLSKPLRPCVRKCSFGEVSGEPYWSGTIVISIENIKEFRHVLLPTLSNIKFKAVVTLLYDDENPAQLRALISKFSRRTSVSLCFQYVDVSHYWVLSDREVELSKNPTNTCDASQSYKAMCAFWIFHIHHVLSDYRWYWRLDTDSRLLAPVTTNVFEWAEKNNQQFVGVHFYQNNACSEGLPEAVRSWLQGRQEKETYAWLPAVFSEPGNVLSYTSYLLNTHFELMDMDLMRTKEWVSYTEMINKSGGIWTARWGDHVIKTLFAGLFWPSMTPSDRSLAPHYEHQQFRY